MMGTLFTLFVAQVWKTQSSPVLLDTLSPARVVTMPNAPEVWNALTLQHATPATAFSVELPGKMPPRHVVLRALVVHLTNAAKASSALLTQVVNQISSSAEKRLKMHLNHVVRELPLHARARALSSVQMAHTASPLCHHVQITLMTSAWGHLGILEDLQDQILLNNSSRLGWLDTGKLDQ
jgi:hypothetical protein